MPLFPESFLADLRQQADIVQVIQEVVSLRRVGGTYKGLCPFHNEKTPSFNVNRENGFFHCFGCGVGGNVFKFVELHERLSFPEAVRVVARKFGVALPETSDSRHDPSADADRENLITLHEVAATFYRDVLASESGRRGRDLLDKRGLDPAIIASLGYGFAPPGRDALLSHLRGKGLSPQLAVKAGLVVDREGRLADRFWNRLMIPICRESGLVVGFGGRAMDADQVPKYLNSPETPIYSKGRTLYGLNVTKTAIRQQGRAIMVEGYFDFAMAIQGGVTAVVASSGTALTQLQAQLLRRFASRVVLSFDPDAAGQGAAVRSCDLLVREGFEVNVARLPAGRDPDLVVREEGGEAFQAIVNEARPYLDFLVDRAVHEHDTATPAGRIAFLNAMLTVAASIPEAAARDQFADRLSLRAGISEDVVRDEIRKAAVARKTTAPTARPVSRAQLTEAERDLLAQLMSAPAEAADAVTDLEPADLVGLAARSLLESAQVLARDERAQGRSGSVASRLLSELSEADVAFLTGLTAQIAKPAPVADCIRALKERRAARERQEIQRQIDAFQQAGGASGTVDVDELLVRKMREARAAQAEG
ncbi:MAG: DNA primase [Vicinamibacteraceae bacterium]